jgi:hypothetical protein
MKTEDDDPLAEYPPELIKSGERGKYAKRYRDEGIDTVLIEPDLREHFPDSDAVNRALREYLEHRKKATP